MSVKRRAYCKQVKLYLIEVFIKQLKSIVTTVEPNRYRISTRFILLKIFGIIVMLMAGYQISFGIYHKNYHWKDLPAMAVVIVIVGLLLYLVFTRNRIDYDGANGILYSINARRKTEEAIPVEKVDKILYSMLGFGNGSYSWVIVYRDDKGERKKLRVFPVPFSNDIERVITDARLRNPNLITRRWSVGWNELFDK